MSIKNFFGGAIINYGPTLPTAAEVPDGALFFKTSGADAGLHIFSFVQDTVPATLGDQTGQLWSPLTGASVSVNANTLDGLDSTAFQLTSSLLNAISGLGTNGILVKTSATTIATRTITGDGTINISPAAGDGVAGNIGVSVNQAGLSLNSIGGTLGLSKGGTGTNLVITQGGIIYGASASSLASTGAGTAGWLLRANGSGAPTWVNPTTIAVSSAASAGTAAELSPGRNINGVLFDGSANITITANTTQSITFNNGGAGAASGTTFNGGTARTISYNTIGAPSTTGDDASGTWAISISGNAASATTATTAGSAGTATTAGSAATLTTGRNFSITGGATAAAVSFNGSGNVVLTVTALDATDLTGTIAAARLPSSATMDITGTATGNLRLDGGNVMTGALRLANGDMGAPSLTFGTDTNTGIFSPGPTNANEIGFTIGGTTRLTITGNDIVSAEPILVPNPNTTAGGYVEVGFRKVPLANMTSGTLTAATAGCMVAASGTITVDDNGAFSTGDTVSIWNNTASSLTLVQAAGMTLYGDAGATGNKTIPPRGLVTIWFYTGAIAKVTGEMS